MQTKTLHHPAPKQQHRPEMSDAEAGELLRQLVRLEQDIHKHLAAIAEIKRKKDALLHQASISIVGLGMVEVCSLCGLKHSGEC